VYAEMKLTDICDRLEQRGTSTLSKLRWLKEIVPEMWSHCKVNTKISRLDFAIIAESWFQGVNSGFFMLLFTGSCVIPIRVNDRRGPEMLWTFAKFKHQSVRLETRVLPQRPVGCVINDSPLYAYRAKV